MKGKKIISVLSAAALTATMAAFPVNVSAAGSWKTAYEELLLSKFEMTGADGDSAGGDSINEKAFSVFDLDSNGTPELIYSEGEWHMAQCEIYTYSGGKLVDIGTMGSYGVFGYVPSSGLITGGYMGMGYSTTTFLELRDNELQSIVTFEDDAGAQEDPEKISYTIDGKKVTEPEYNSSLNKMGSQQAITIGRTYKLNTESIRIAIKGTTDYKDAYSTMLLHCIFQNDYTTTKFRCGDVTGDKIPELFIINNGITDIYTYASNRIQYLGNDFNYVSGAEEVKQQKICLSTDGKYLMFMSKNDKDNTFMYTFYRVKNGKLVMSAAMSYDTDYITEKKVYKLNNTVVSKKKFYNKLKTYTKKKYNVISAEYLPTSANVEKLFG